ncbi:MAG: hypothetical protein A3J74_07050 [Elusimicrobia bacterium RIFCSPHIGHO2_02_FULL_57_9]|nr:MAG: hypothetical protein A3J74_07050 [Elusimicrobia bacterium RIFCSPHIGHO2_02_FULL_57_9]
MTSLWENKTVLITSGPTREYLDPIRFLTNASSGRMGWALARQARRLGARVTVISGPSPDSPPQGIRVVPVVTALQMHRAALKFCPQADVVIAAAAVSDWRLPAALVHKIQRTPKNLRLTLKPNPDIIRAVSRRRKSSRSGLKQVLIGFALETRRPLASAREKMKRKGLDMIVVNDSSALSARRSRAAVLNRRGGIRKLPVQSKQATARAIFQEIRKFL